MMKLKQVNGMKWGMLLVLLFVVCLGLPAWAQESKTIKPPEEATNPIVEPTQPTGELKATSEPMGDSTANEPADAGLIEADNANHTQPFKVNQQLVGTKITERYVPNEIIVKFKFDAPDLTINTLNERHGVTALFTHRRAGYKRLRIPEGKTVEEMVNMYKNNPNVEYAEPNYYVTTCMTPNDEYFDYQWNFHKYSGGINMESAWDIQAGGNPGIIVAVIDTGVAYEDYVDPVDGQVYCRAPDLANTHFVPGHDFINDDTHPNDDHYHGTHVTGTIAQNTNNNLGTAGIAFNCSIMPVKVLDADGNGTEETVAQGIYYAVEHGAQVINMSLGGPDDCIVLADACAYAYEHGVTIVCSAGNRRYGDWVEYPAAYDSCMAVGATRYDETRCGYSCFGAPLDIVAPGGDFSVDQNNDGCYDGILQQTFGPGDPTNFGYWLFQGTSMASPHVAGVAALLIADGVTGPDSIRARLQDTAKDLGTEGWDEYYGWGLLDAAAAFGIEPPIYLPGDVNNDGLVDIGDVIYLINYIYKNGAVPTGDDGDVNNDGLVNILDVVYLINWLYKGGPAPE
ncbi:S8 family serine peptidase [Planctomycetota bacterium]